LLIPCERHGLACWACISTSFLILPFNVGLVLQVSVELLLPRGRFDVAEAHVEEDEGQKDGREAEDDDDGRREAGDGDAHHPMPAEPSQGRENGRARFTISLLLFFSFLISKLDQNSCAELSTPHYYYYL